MRVAVGVVGVGSGSSSWIRCSTMEGIHQPELEIEPESSSLGQQSRASVLGESILRGSRRAQNLRSTGFNQVKARDQRQPSPAGARGKVSYLPR